MLRNIQGWPLVIIILAIIILVGWKRLPDAARSVGRSMRIFKSEVEQMTNKDDAASSAASSDTVDGRSGPATDDRAEQDRSAGGVSQASASREGGVDDEACADETRTHADETRARPDEAEPRRRDEHSG